MRHRLRLGDKGQQQHQRSGEESLFHSTILLQVIEVDSLTHLGSIIPTLQRYKKFCPVTKK
jgi:hypothetical protein